MLYIFVFVANAGEVFFEIVATDDDGAAAVVGVEAQRLGLAEIVVEEEVDMILREVPRIVEYLRGFSPIWQDLESGRRAHML